MDWLPLILLVLAGLVIFIWIFWLTFRVNELEKQAEAAPHFPTVDRTNNRLGNHIEQLQETLAKNRRDVDSFDRRLGELEQIVRHLGSRLANPSQSLSAFEATNYSTGGHASPPLGADAESERSVFDEEVLKAYNDLASSFDNVLRDAFVAKFSPSTVAFAAQHFSENESGKFWLIVGQDGHRALVVPSGKVAREWEKLYRAMNGMQAQEALGGVFDIAPGGRLKVDAAAIAVNTSGAFALSQNGRISGI